MSSSEFVVVETEYGPVQGHHKTTILGMDFINFQGIPYMAAAVGKLRFRDAQPPKKWTEPLEPREISYTNFNFFSNKMEGQEDGGIINVFTKNVRPEKKFPVMVWVMIKWKDLKIKKPNKCKLINLFQLDSWRWFPDGFIVNRILWSRLHPSERCYHGFV